MIPLPYFEDILVIYYDYMKETLYPTKTKNKILVYILSTLHIIGVIQIAYGIFLPPSLLPLNTIYLATIIISYFIFNGHCFMTLLTNKFSGLTRTPLYIKFTTAKLVLLINFIISIIGVLNPKYSLYNNIFN